MATLFHSFGGSWWISSNRSSKSKGSLRKSLRSLQKTDPQSWRIESGFDASPLIESQRSPRNNQGTNGKLIGSDSNSY